MEGLQESLLDQLRASTVQLAFVLGTILLLTRLAKAQPTRLTLGLILLPVPLMLLELWWPWLAWGFAVYTPLLMLVLLCDAFWLSSPARHLSFSRNLSRKFSIGQENAVLIDCYNNGPADLEGELRDGVPAGLMHGRSPADLTFPVRLPAFSHQAVIYQLLPVRRGLYRFEQVYFRYKSRLRLLWLTTTGGRHEEIKVWPDLRRLREMRIKASRALTAGELQRRALGQEGTQFAGLRHYFAGDDVRKMAWQATAKLDLPVVRTYEHEAEQPILVLLDGGRKMEALSGRLQKFDWALNATLAFMGVAMDRGDCVGAGVFSNRIMAHVPVGTGAGHLNRILEQLSRVEPEPVEPDYEAVMLSFARKLKRRSLVVILTDLIDPLASRNLLRSLSGFSAGHVLMVVTLADSQTLALAERMPSSAYGAYQRGVALDLLDLRRQTRAELAKAHQAIVIDAPPDRLDEALIARYLQLKQQHRF